MPIKKGIPYVHYCEERAAQKYVMPEKQQSGEQKKMKVERSL